MPKECGMRNLKPPRDVPRSLRWDSTRIFARWDFSGASLGFVVPERLPEWALWRIYRNGGHQRLNTEFLSEN